MAEYMGVTGEPISKWANGIGLSTEPRWMRLCDTFGEHTQMTIDMTKAYCDGFQTTRETRDGWGKDSVNTMVKHFPGGGTGEGGRDAHYAYGKYAVYPGGNFDEHLKPFARGLSPWTDPPRRSALSCPTTPSPMTQIRKVGRTWATPTTNT